MAVFFNIYLDNSFFILTFVLQIESNLNIPKMVNENKVGVKLNDENQTSDTMELKSLDDLPEPKIGVSLIIKLPNGHKRVFYPREKVDFKGNLTGTLEYSQKITPAYLKEGTIFWTNPYGKNKK